MKWSFLLFLGLMGGCGQTVRQRPHVKNILYQSISKRPVFLPKQSKSCLSHELTETDKNIELFLFLNAQMTGRQQNIVPLTSEGLVQSPTGEVILDSLYGKDREDLYRLGLSPTGETIVIGKQRFEHQQGQKVFICPDTKYTERSIERAALNAAHFIQKTHDKIKDLFPEVSIAPIELIVDPHLRQTFEMERGDHIERIEMYLTDNAFYHPADKTISFLPMGQEAIDAGTSIAFWEIPMVPSHEYGHHIFQTFFQRSYHTAAFKPCFDNRHPLRASHGMAGADRKVTSEIVLDSYNEGFADLVARYTLSEEESAITGVRCLQVNRDSRSDHFFDGTPKAFTPDALDSFFSTTTHPSKSCEEADFQDSHALGAVFAHSADVLLSQFTTSKETKLMIVIDWVKQLNLLYPQLGTLTPKDLHKFMYKLFVDVTRKNFNRDADTVVCPLVQRFYPDLSHEIAGCP